MLVSVGAVVSVVADTFKPETVPVIVPSMFCAVIVTPFSTTLSVTALAKVFVPASPETNM